MRGTGSEQLHGEAQVRAGVAEAGLVDCEVLQDGAPWQAGTPTTSPFLCAHSVSKSREAMLDERQLIQFLRRN